MKYEEKVEAQFSSSNTKEAWNRFNVMMGGDGKRREV